MLIGWAMMRRVDDDDDGDDVKDNDRQKGRLLCFLYAVINDMMGTQCCKAFIN